MPVYTSKPGFNKQLDIWNKCRDVVEGQEAMHQKGEVYLNRLSGQTDDEYAAYVGRALFYNATQRTVDAMKGLLFRKEPIIKVPKAIEPWLEDIDFNGNSINVFIEDIACEVLTTGRYGLLIEHPQVFVEDENSVITQSQSEYLNIRPFFAKYPAETIINWKVDNYQNQKRLCMVVLKEIYEDVIDEFSSEYLTQYRVLDIDPETSNYRQRIYRSLKSGKDEDVILISEIYPLKNGQTMKFIPFVLFGTKGISYDMEKPPILDLVNVNISHYKTTADLEHGAHFTGLPTAIVTGHDLEEGTTLKIGSSTAWVFSEPDADAKYLEFSGSGLEALEKRIEKKENQMATLGARMLANEKASAETTETHIIKRQGENSALSSIASSIESSVIKAFTILCEWANITGEIDYKINRDFLPSKMSSQDLLALLQVYQSGTIGFSDFIENLKNGEIIDSQKTVEEIRSEIDSQGPIGGDFNNITLPL